MTVAAMLVAVAAMVVFLVALGSMGDPTYRRPIRLGLWSAGLMIAGAALGGLSLAASLDPLTIPTLAVAIPVGFALVVLAAPRSCAWLGAAISSQIGRWIR